MSWNSEVFGDLLLVAAGAALLVGSYVVTQTPRWHRNILGHYQRSSMPVPHCIETRCSCGRIWEDWS
jgi:hypothetical protein